MVSIIIPTFNYAHYLTETLNSVKSQSYKNWECIVIDDGSTDNTKQIVTSFASMDNRFKYFYQKNSGVSAARNYGIKNAIGDYIQFLDGDDLLEPEKIKSQIEVFDQNSNFDIVYSNFKFFDDGNLEKLRDSLKGDKAENWMPKFSTKGKEIINCLSKINFLVISSPLIKKKIIDQIGFFNENMKGLEDRDFWMRCALANSFFHFYEGSNGLALIRVHEGSLSTNEKIMNDGHFKFLIHCMYYNNTSLFSKISFFLKYVELFWDSIFTKVQFKNQSWLLGVASILFFPVYLFIKLIRLFRKN